MKPLKRSKIKKMMQNDVVYIPMFGKNYSLNVHVSGALVGYEVKRDKYECR